MWKIKEANNEKLRKWPKTSIWTLFVDDFEVIYLQIKNFSEK